MGTNGTFLARSQEKVTFFHGCIYKVAVVVQILKKLKVKARLFSSHVVDFKTLQVSEAELSQLTSLSSVQTKGLKRQFAEEEWLNRMKESGAEIEQVVVHKNEGLKFFHQSPVVICPSNAKSLQQ